MTNEQIFNIIDMEARDLGLYVIVDEKLPLELYLNYGPQCAGCASCIDFSIHVFMETLAAIAAKLDAIATKLGRFGKITNWERDPQKTLGKMVRSILVHEARHVEQFRYLEERGVDPAKYLEANSKKNYWLRRHELDAYLAQYTGIRLPLKWVFGV